MGFFKKSTGFLLFFISDVSAVTNSCDLLYSCSVSRDSSSITGYIRDSSSCTTTVSDYSSISLTTNPFSVTPTLSGLFNVCNCSPSTTCLSTYSTMEVSGLTRTSDSSPKTCYMPNSDCTISLGHNMISTSNTGYTSINSGSGKVVLSQSSTCSGTSMSLSANTFSASSTLSAADGTWTFDLAAASSTLGASSSFRICYYCDSSGSSCSSSSYATLGVVKIYGPTSSQSLTCYPNVVSTSYKSCAFTLTQVDSSGGYVSLVASGDDCSSGNAVVGYVASSTVSGATTTATATFSDIPYASQGTKSYKVCYCNTASAATDCSRASGATGTYYTYSPGTLTLQGPSDSTQTYSCSTGSTCSLTISGTGFTINSYINIKANGATDCTGTTGSTTGVYDGSTYFVISSLSLTAGTYPVCFCQRSSTACTTYDILAGLLTVRAPDSGQVLGPCYAGGTCSVTVTGSSLSLTDYIMITTQSVCSSATPSAYFGRNAYMKASTVSSTDGLFSSASIVNSTYLAAADYRVCWCGTSSCVDSTTGNINSAQFTTSVGTLTIVAPYQNYILTCFLGEECRLSIRSGTTSTSETLSSVDRVSLKDTCTDGTTITGMGPVTSVSFTDTTQNGLQYTFGTLSSVPTSKVDAKICWCRGSSCDPTMEIGVAFLYASNRPQSISVTNTTAGRITSEWLSLSSSSDTSKCIDSSVTSWKVAVYRVTTTTTRPVGYGVAYDNNTMRSTSSRWLKYFDTDKYVNYQSVVTAISSLNDGDIPFFDDSAGSAGLRRRRLDKLIEKRDYRMREEMEKLYDELSDLDWEHEIVSKKQNFSFDWDNGDDDAEEIIDDEKRSSFESKVKTIEERKGIIEGKLNRMAKETLTIRSVNDRQHYDSASKSFFKVYTMDGYTMFYMDTQGIPHEIVQPECELQPGDELHAQYLSHRRILQSTTADTETLRMNTALTSLAATDSSYSAETMATTADYFAVKRQPTAIFQISSNSSTVSQSYTFTGLTPYLTYYLQLQGVTSSGLSLWSAQSDSFYVPLPCGNGGPVDAYEECDDGNTNNGDGCSSACLIEAGYECTYNDNLLDRSYCTLKGFDTVSTILFILIIVTLALALSTCILTICKTVTDSSGEMYACLRYERDQSGVPFKKKIVQPLAVAPDGSNNPVMGRRSTRFEGTEDPYAILPQILRFLAFACTTFIVTCQHISILPLILPSESMTTVKYLSYAMRYSNFQFAWWKWGDRLKTPTKYGAHKDRFAADTLTGAMEQISDEANGVLWQFTSYFLANIFFMFIITLILILLVLLFRRPQRRAENAATGVPGVSGGVSVRRKSMILDTSENVFSRKSNLHGERQTFIDLPFIQRFAVVFNEWALMGYFTRLSYVFFFPVCTICLLQLASVPIADQSLFLFSINIFIAQIFLLVLLMLPIVIIVRVRSAVQGGIAFTLGAVENSLGTTFSVYRHEYLDWIWRPIVMRLILVFTAVYLSSVPWFSALIAAISTSVYLVFFIKCQPYRSLYMQVMELFDWAVFTFIFLYSFIASAIGSTTALDFPVAVLATILFFSKFLLVLIGTILWTSIMYMPPAKFLKMFAWSKAWIDDEEFIPLSISGIIKKLFGEKEETADSFDDVNDLNKMDHNELTNAAIEGSFVKIWVVDSSGKNGRFEFVKMSEIKDAPKSALDDSDTDSSSFYTSGDDDDSEESDEKKKKKKASRRKKQKMLSETNERSPPAPGQIGKVFGSPNKALDPKSLGDMWTPAVASSAQAASNNLNITRSPLGAVGSLSRVSAEKTEASKPVDATAVSPGVSPSKSNIEQQQPMVMNSKSNNNNSNNTDYNDNNNMTYNSPTAGMNFQAGNPFDDWMPEQVNNNFNGKNGNNNNNNNTLSFQPNFNHQNMRNNEYDGFYDENGVYDDEGGYEYDDNGNYDDGYDNGNYDDGYDYDNGNAWEYEDNGMQQMPFPDNQFQQQQYNPSQYGQNNNQQQQYWR